MSVRTITGDCRDVLQTLADESVHCMVTSPPYFGLRDYGVAGQIGLEPTPDAYVAELVAVFREVRRVLRSDGTLFLNLGDSYASGGFGWRPNNASASTLDGGKATSRTQNRNGVSVPLGLKPKDLIGIPWLVAKALQAPYYTGKIKDERDRVWLAAMIDAEGCMFIHKRKAGDSNHSEYTKKDGTVSRYSRTQDNYGAGLEVANTSEAIVQRCIEITGQGSICSQSPDQNNSRKQTIFRWNMRSNECRGIIREIYPHLVAKQQQARILIGCPSSGEAAAAAHQALIGLHNGISSDVDFTAPASMFEPGWYLRQDIIWAKKNCMPESVTDRCTKAHEYLFLLTKSARYYFDAEAIKEEDAGHGSGNGFAGRQGTANYRPQLGSKGLDGMRRTGGEGTQESWLPGSGRNKRSVWTVSTQPYSEVHFATFPPALIEPCILAGCPKGGMVLDPFGGAGTTGLVADRLQRNAILIELNPEYAAMAERRIHNDAPLFVEAAE